MQSFVLQCAISHGGARNNEVVECVASAMARGELCHGRIALSNVDQFNEHDHEMIKDGFERAFIGRIGSSIPGDRGSEFVGHGRALTVWGMQSERG